VAAVTPEVSCVIPTIPVRSHELGIAVGSVAVQTYPVTDLIVPMDWRREGAARNRQRGLDRVGTAWVCFLDDDDYFLGDHVEKLMRCALEQNADFVFSWYEVNGGSDPRADEFGLEWDPENPRQTTVVTLVKTELAQEVGFVSPKETPEGLASPDRHYAGEDWYFTKGCNDAGAKIVHLPQKTWVWRHTGKNTSGLAKNW
jgi:hypothetical protein